MKLLIVGYGEVGKGLYSYIKFSCPDADVDTFDTSNMDKQIGGEYDLLLICFPYGEGFVSEVKKYQDIFLPKGVVIFSTVPIGTTEKIENAVHCPVEGIHPMLTESMLHWHWFVGGRVNSYIINLFHSFNNHVTFIENPRVTELAKLQSTTNYGVMIEYARYIGKICEEENIDYNYIKQYNQAYNALYESMLMPNIKRYVLNPPEGDIGGHCVRQNAQLLNEQYKNILTEVVADGKNINILYNDREVVKK